MTFPAVTQPRISRALSAACLVAFGLSSAASAESIGEGEEQVWMDKSRSPVEAEVIDRLGSVAPLDVTLTRHDGKVTTFEQAFRVVSEEAVSGEGAVEADAAERVPVLLVIGYYECPMLCSLVLNGAFEGLQGVGLPLGSEYRVAVVSIDPEETVELAKTKRANYLKRFKLDGSPEQGVDFYVADAVQSKRLADAVGFNYFFDEKSQQWAHGAGIFFLSKDGTLVRTLTGVNFPSQDMRFALVDAGEGKVGTLVDRIVMSCFHYVPDAHQYGFYIWGAVRLAGLLIVLGLGSFLAYWWRRERQRKGPAAVV
jgi:protein SCO1/2